MHAGCGVIAVSHPVSLCAASHRVSSPMPAGTIIQVAGTRRSEGIPWGAMPVSTFPAGPIIRSRGSERRNSLVGSDPTPLSKRRSRQKAIPARRIVPRIGEPGIPQRPRPPGPCSQALSGAAERKIRSLRARDTRQNRSGRHHQPTCPRQPEPSNAGLHSACPPDGRSLGAEGIAQNWASLAIFRWFAAHRSRRVKGDPVRALTLRPL